MLHLYVNVTPEGWTGLFDKESGRSLWDFSLLDGQDERFLLEETVRALAVLRRVEGEVESANGGWKMIDLWLFYGRDLSVDPESVAFAQIRQTRIRRTEAWSIYDSQPLRWFTSGALALPKPPPFRIQSSRTDFLDHYRDKRV